MDGDGRALFCTQLVSWRHLLDGGSVQCVEESVFPHFVSPPIIQCSTQSAAAAAAEEEEKEDFGHDSRI